jgi:hypothetical protein
MISGGGFSTGIGFPAFGQGKAIFLPLVLCIKQTAFVKHTQTAINLDYARVCVCVCQTLLAQCPASKGKSTI